MKTLRLTDIKVDPTINPRVKGLDQPTVDEYAERIGNGDTFPPVVVYYDGEEYWLSEGFHRYAGHEKSGRDSIAVEVRNGGRTEAEDNADSSNNNHGLKRSNEDKRNAVRRKLGRNPDWTDEKIADHCGVDHKLVNDVRSTVAAESTLDSDEQAGEFGLIPNSDVRETNVRTSPGRPKTKEKHAKQAAKLLLADHTRDDARVAKEVGCAVKTVQIARKALVDKGRIPALPKAKPELVNQPAGSESGKLDEDTSGPRSLREAAGEGAGESGTDPAPKPAEEVHPADEIVSRINQLCHVLDECKAKVLLLAKESYGGHIHWESVEHSIVAARKALWQARPTEPCELGTGINGTDRTSAARVLRRGAR